MDKINEIVVISGKGGTGKTSITSAFAYLAGRDVILADCDVDAADLYLILKPKIIRKEDFYSSQVAVIDPQSCTACGACYDVCHFDAIIPGDVYQVNEMECEGCGYCEKVCPVQAITMKARKDGRWYISQTRLGSYMAFAQLAIGMENSGKLVSLVKNVAKQLAEKAKLDKILIDGPPGISCPVVSTLSGATYAVMVAEPTVSGIHDLERVYEIAQRFRVKVGVIINKADLNQENYQKIRQFIQKNNLSHLADIPYDESFIKAMTLGMTIIEYGQTQIADILKQAWQTILTELETN